MSHHNESAIELVQRAIKVPGARFTAVSLEMDENMGESRMREIGLMLAQIEGSKCWWLGDFVLAFQKKKGEHYTEGQAEDMGTTPGAMRIYRMVAAFFPASKRQVNLTFAHHYEAICGADGSLGAAQGWLKNAVKEGWTVAQLRAEIRKSKASYLPDGHSATGDGYSAIVDAARFAGQRLKHIDDYTPESAAAILSDLDPVLRFAESLREVAAKKSA